MQFFNIWPPIVVNIVALPPKELFHQFSYFCMPIRLNYEYFHVKNSMSWAKVQNL